MLERIEIRDFALARDVTIGLGSGFNVFTGETGAGKSLVVDALAFCSGARRGADVVSTGAERAEVRVTLDSGRSIERTVGLSGRSALRVDGATSSIDVVKDELEGRLEIHGQSDQLALLKSAVQLSILDRFGGCEELAADFATAASTLRELRRDLLNLRSDTRERERRIDQLRFEAGEISDAALTPGEPELLRVDAARLSSTASRIHDAGQALEALDDFEIGDVAGAISRLAEADTGAAELQDAAALLESTAAELVRALRQYSESIEEDPERLAAVTERLDLISRLRRKYGDSAEEIIAYGQKAEEELAAFERSGESEDDLLAKEADTLAGLARIGERLSKARRTAAHDLVSATASELGTLGMEGASLAVGFSCSDDPCGVQATLPDYEVIGTAALASRPTGEDVARAFSSSGLDQVEFLASFNAGEEPRPLAQVASGGETSRFLLALTAVFGGLADSQTIVLDEADEGVGGRSGTLVGEALRRLAAKHQVLCVTHLPQVAACADRHFVVSKTETAGRTASTLREVAGEERVEELAAMLGGNSEANRAAARELISGGD